ncbi:MAG: preprotein translocase subunit YajC [Acidobacteria bacterium]|nr:preprotein translocase subunit YajC [Acidobacteriota bacterium]
MSILTILQSAGGGNFLIGILPWALIIGVFYVLIILPQRRRQRELQETISNLKAGDKIITTGGIIGTVTMVRDTSLLIRSADKSMLEIARTAVAGIQGDEEEKK